MDFSLDPNFDFDDFEDGDTHKPAVADSSPAKRTDEKEYVAAQDGLSQLPLALQLLLEREHCLCYATVRELVPCSANVGALSDFTVANNSFIIIAFHSFRQNLAV